MARQMGIIPIKGTIDNLTFYMMDGNPQVRRKTSLDKARMKRDKKFKNTMKSADRLGRGSKIGSKIYRMYFPGIKDMKLFRTITGQATKMIKTGLSPGQVLEMLKKEYETKPAQIIETNQAVIRTLEPLPWSADILKRYKEG